MKASNTTSSSEENYGALPSSYRRLRKSRSMHPSRAIRQIPFLKASKSLSRLSPRRGWRLGPSPVICDLQEVPPKADLERLDNMGQPSFRDPDTDCERRWRYTAKSHMPVQPGDVISERSSSRPVKSSLRSFSVTVRSRVKRLLSFTQLHQSHQSQLAEPCQPFEPFDIVANIYDPPTIVDEADDKSISDERYDTVSHLLPPLTSRDSLVSNSQSRVTSWTNSSVTSLGLRSVSVQKHRLSVIKEDGGPHQPSSSAGCHVGGVACVQTSGQTMPSAGPILSQVDSQRIYSALIKRISQEEAELERTRAAVEAIDSVKNSKQFDEWPSSRGDPTIRMVQSDSMLSSTVSLAESPRNDDDDDICHRDDGNSHSVVACDSDLARGAEKPKYTMDAQSTFFPTSPERRSTAPSPFRKLMSRKDANDRHRDVSWSRRLASWSSLAEPVSDRSIYSTPSFNDISINPATNGSLRSDQGAMTGLEKLGAAERSRKEDGQMGETPPASTPGRLHFVSPGAVSTSTTPSPSLQHRFVARLSRPFNMDVPTQNRPFDSMYLGKRTPGHADTLGNSRLSVAPRKSKSYGALQGEELGTLGDTQSSGYSTGLSSRTRAASKVMGILGSNRIVSNFLKSRRARSGGATEANSATDESPRFL